MFGKIADVSICTCAFVVCNIRWDTRSTAIKFMSKNRNQFLLLLVAIAVAHTSDWMIRPEVAAAILITGLRVFMDKPFWSDVASFLAALLLVLVIAVDFDQSSSSPRRFLRIAKKGLEPLGTISAMLFVCAHHCDEWRYSLEKQKVLWICAVSFGACQFLGFSTSCFAYIAMHKNGNFEQYAPLLLVLFGLTSCFCGELLKERNTLPTFSSSILHTGCAVAGAGIFLLLYTSLPVDVCYTAAVCLNLGIVVIVSGVSLERNDWLVAGRMKRFACIVCFFSGCAIALCSTIALMLRCEVLENFPTPHVGWAMATACLSGLFRFV